MTAHPGGGTGDSGTSGAKIGFESLPSPLDAVDDLRSAAKWTLGAAGLVGAALISGGPLVAVGQVHGTAHALLAGLGLLVALAGVGLAIWSTSKVLEPRLTTRASFKEPVLAGLVQIIEAEPEQFFGVAATSVDGLFKRQDDNRAIAVDLARQMAAAKDPKRRAQLQAQLRRVEENAVRVAAYIRWLLALGHVWRIQEDLRRSRVVTFAGGTLVIIGAVLFFSITGNSGA
jgi:hypothetical protein